MDLVKLPCDGPRLSKGVQGISVGRFAGNTLFDKLAGTVFDVGFELEQYLLSLTRIQVKPEPLY